jgi:hypothetical protein
MRLCGRETKRGGIECGHPFAAKTEGYPAKVGVECAVSKKII